MTAVTQEKQVVQSVTLAQRPGAEPLLDNKPLVGGQITIRLAVTPGTITLLAAPVTVALTMLVGWVLLTSLSLPLYPREMFAAGIVNATGALIASLPLFILMNRGAQAIARASIGGMGLRMGLILAGVALASAGGWGLSRMPLFYWVIACYFPLWIIETATVAWLFHKVKA